MRLIEKKWYWKMQLIWYGMNTVIGDRLYYPKGKVPNDNQIAHCEWHARQQAGGIWGIFKHWFRYLLCFPVLKNSYRWQCEYDAYKYGSGLRENQIDAAIGGSQYGWIKRPKK